MKEIACAITGHRPTRFKFKYKEDYSLCKKIKRSLSAVLLDMYEQGIRHFYVGGALGVDMWAGEAIAAMMQRPEYGDVKLYCILPFPGYDQKWDDKSKHRMARIKAASTETMFVCQQERSDAYKQRNYYMVDHSSFLLAIYDQNHSIRSGTGQTVNYALKNGHTITYIHPDTAEITPPLPTKK